MVNILVRGGGGEKYRGKSQRERFECRMRQDQRKIKTQEKRLQIYAQGTGQSERLTPVI
jgi:hypothetical protein